MLGGLPLDDNALGKDAYLEVEPGEHFLGSAHTMANYETAYYEAALSDNDNLENWEEQGSKDTERRAYDRWNQLLKDYEAPPLDEAKDEELQAYIDQRKAEIPDAWY
jgi:trimethylamine--corrinoid protein Co-methyltransferase